MMPPLAILLPILAQVVDVLVGALTKHPELEPHLGPVIANILPVLSQSAGETEDQTAKRRAVAEAIFAKYQDAIVAPAPPAAVPPAAPPVGPSNPVDPATGRELPGGLGMVP